VPAGTLEFEYKPVEVTLIPVLARLVRPDNRRPGHAQGRGRMPSRLFTLDRCQCLRFGHGPSQGRILPMLPVPMMATVLSEIVILVRLS
jgi:hypothetical protein